MKTNSYLKEYGSVLIVTMMTITIMTLICATSFYISTQNSRSGMQTAGWQQALTAAEAGIDAGMRGLNATVSASPSPWNGWKAVAYSSPASNYTLPAVEPTATATSSATAAPDTSHYNYYPSSSLSLNSPNTEGATAISAWVTVDKVGSNLVPTSNPSLQWYRIRSTGRTTYPTNSSLLTRVSNNRLDNDLRNSIAMNFNRKGGSYTGPTRTIEVIANPVGTTNSLWGDGVYLKNALTMSGSGVMGHYDSRNTSTSTFLSAPSVYRSTDYTETLIGMMNANGSNISNTYVYGGMAYSTTGSVPQNTKNVQGSITTPFNATPPTTSDPIWTPDMTYASGSPPFSSISPGSSNNSPSNPYKVKITGNFTVPAGKTLTINAPNNGSGTTYLEIWITGSFTTSGSGFINQANNVHVKYYVDGSVTTSGGSFNNQSGLSQNQQFVVVGSGSVTVSGGGNFIGTIEAPNSSVTVSGSGVLIGALIGNTMTISGGASFYYDDALSAFTGDMGVTSTSNYAFASWFEDNSDPARNAFDTSQVTHPIIY